MRGLRGHVSNQGNVHCSVGMVAQCLPWNEETEVELGLKPWPGSGIETP